MLIRPECHGDHAAVRAVIVAAFEAQAEADLVCRLRREADPIVSLVAEDDAVVVGHIMFSPVSLADYASLRIMGLAPMAVAPARQFRGIGTALVQSGLACCLELNFGAVVVLGHPDYYPRFGFRPAVEYGMTCEYDVPAEAFMVAELKPGYLAGASGVVSYHAAFKDA